MIKRTIVLVVVALAGGCASRAPLAGVTPSSADGTGLSRYMADVRRATLEAGRGPLARTGTLESGDADLHTARAALTVAPTAANHRALGDVYLRHGVLDAAFDQFSAAIKRSSREAGAYEGRARIWREWGMPQRGLNDAHRAIYFSRNDPAPHNTLGTLLLRMGLLVEAERAFELARVLAPRAIYVLNNLCYLDLLAGRYPHAIEVCRDALRVAPDSRTTRNNLALAYAAVGDTTAAYHEFSLAGGAADASYNLGIALTALGRHGDAARAFDVASTLKPDWQEARDRARNSHNLAGPSALVP